MPTFEIIACPECDCRQKVPVTSLGRTFLCAKCGAKIFTEALPTAVEADAVEARPAAPRDTGENDVPEDSPTLKRREKAENRPKRRLGELLIEEGFIDKDQLDEALRVQASQGGKLAEVLMSLSFLDAKAFDFFLANQPGVPSINLAEYHIPPELPGIIPREFALKHEVIPIDKLGRMLTVAMACPLDSRAIKELEDFTGFRVKALLCSVHDIREALERHYPIN